MGMGIYSKGKVSIYVMFILLSMMLVGCNNQEEVSLNTVKVETTKSENNDEIVNNDDMITKLVVLEEDELSKHLEYVNLHIDEFSSDEIKENIHKISELQELNIAKYNEFFSENISLETINSIGYRLDINNIDEIENEQDMKLLTEIFGRGYKAVNEEGYVYLDIDPSLLLKYNEYLADEQKDYNEILIAESENPTASDACLMISWDELINRAYKCELYLSNYESSDNREEIVSKYRNYISMYLYGIDNSRITGDTLDEVLKEVLESYKKAVSEMEGTKTGEIVKVHFNAIVQNDFKVIQGNTENLLEELLNDEFFN